MDADKLFKEIEQEINDSSLQEVLFGIVEICIEKGRRIRSGDEEDELGERWWFAAAEMIDNVTYELNPEDEDDESDED